MTTEHRIAMVSMPTLAAKFPSFYPAFCLAWQRSAGRLLGLVEVGASAGLNLSY